MINYLPSLQERLNQLVLSSNNSNIEYHHLLTLSQELIDIINLNEKVSEDDYKRIQIMLINMFMLGTLSKSNK